MTSVLIVDDEAFVRTAVRTILTSHGLDVVGEADDGDQVLAAVARHRPDVVLIDLEMRRVSGLVAISQISARPDGPPCVVLTTYGSEVSVAQAIDAGAAGFLSKNDPPDTWAGHLVAVAAGGGALGPGAAAAVIRRMAAPGAVPPERAAAARKQLQVLTEKERAVVAVVAGRTYAEIGALLYMSPHTVKAHIGRANAKLGYTDRAQLAVLAALAGLDT
ncbi:response regulator transcription factor [Promicromonospora sp. NPDC023987]|uniref:response regulator transcription factor n=1 Tax=Promicromonospora sp. NPDC023987 TaxID=3155360 RepID=UPI0033F6A91B